MHADEPERVRMGVCEREHEESNATASTGCSEERTIHDNVLGARFLFDLERLALVLLALLHNLRMTLLYEMIRLEPQRRDQVGRPCLGVGRAQVERVDLELGEAPERRLEQPLQLRHEPGRHVAGASCIVGRQATAYRQRVAASRHEEYQRIDATLLLLQTPAREHRQHDGRQGVAADHDSRANEQDGERDEQDCHAHLVASLAVC